MPGDLPPWHAVHDQGRAQVGRLAAAVQEATGETVELAHADQGRTGATSAEATCANGIALHVVRTPEPKRGFILLPRRRMVERSFARATRCRRLARDHGRLLQTLAGLRFVAFITFMLAKATTAFALVRNTAWAGPP